MSVGHETFSSFHAKIDSHGLWGRQRFGEEGAGCYLTRFSVPKLDPFI